MESETQAPGEDEDWPSGSEGEARPSEGDGVERRPPETIEPEATPPAIGEPPPAKTALLLMTGLAVVAVDQVSKVAIREFLLDQGTNSVPLLGGWLRITYVENAGAAFGLFQNQTLLFVIIGIIVVAGILFGHGLLPTHRTALALCLGLQLGGASGNLIDRIRHDGHVFDFIHVPPFPVFNIADSAIVVGTIVLAYHLLFMSTKPRPERGNFGQ